MVEIVDFAVCIVCAHVVRQCHSFIKAQPLLVSHLALHNNDSVVTVLPMRHDEYFDYLKTSSPAEAVTIPSTAYSQPTQPHLVTNSVHHTVVELIRCVQCTRFQSILCIMVTHLSVAIWRVKYHPRILALKHLAEINSFHVVGCLSLGVQIIRNLCWTMLPCKRVNPRPPVTHVPMNQVSNGFDAECPRTWLSFCPRDERLRQSCRRHMRTTTRNTTGFALNSSLCYIFSCAHRCVLLCPLSNSVWLLVAIAHL